MTLLLAIQKRIKSYQTNRKINRQDIALFLRQLATLLIAGLPLLQVCHILESSQPKLTMRRLIERLKKDILSGHSIHASLRKQAGYFDGLTCQLIQIGEQTGRLDQLLTMIVAHQDKQSLMRKKIQQALFYPAFILLVACLMTTCLLLFVIPHFATLFQETNISLPWITRCLFKLSIFLQRYSMPLIITFIGAIFCLLLSTSIRDSLKASLIPPIKTLPLIKNHLQLYRLANFARHLAITLSAGIPITDALQLLMNSHPNAPEAFDQMLVRLHHHLSSGLELHRAMATSTYFPPLMMQMVQIGEESGTLDALLNKVADFFESELDQQVAQLGQLLEPLIMLILGVLIGGLVIGMYLPIFKLGSTL